MRTSVGSALAALVICSVGGPALAQSGELQLRMLDIGQGDGLLLDCPDGSLAMVVDSADSRESDGGLTAWKAAVKPRLDAATKIPLVIGSHPHADHIGGFPWLLQNYAAKVEMIVDNGREHTSQNFKDYAALRDQLPVAKYDKATPWPTEVELCGGTVKATYFVADGFTNAECADDPNVCSVFVRIDYNQTSFLLTGDAHDESEKALLEDDGMVEWLDVDVLKVGHHGSETSSDPDFLMAVSPTCAIISSGDWKQSTTNKRTQRNDGSWSGYGHPRVLTIRKLNAELERQGQGMRNVNFPRFGGRLRGGYPRSRTTGHGEAKEVHGRVSA